MMRLFSGLALLFMATQLYAQQSCCAHDAFASLGNDAAFVIQHEQPLPFQLQDPVGEMINFETTDGKQGNAYVIMRPGGGNKYLLVFHEWWGLNDYVKKESDRLFDELKDTHIIAIDLYDGQVAATREEATANMQALKSERAESIIRGAINYADMLSHGNAEFATVGWCMGGGWSLQAGILAGEKNKAVVMYYGMPETDDNRLQELESPVLFIFARQDKWINFEVVASFKKQMSRLKKNLAILEYDADHSFANPSNPKYDKASAEDAHGQVVEFLYYSLH